MTSKSFATLHCDKAGCTTQETTVHERSFSCGGPHRWAEVNWTEPPKEGTQHGAWEELHVCPDHFNELLKWLATPE